MERLEKLVMGFAFFALSLGFGGLCSLPYFMSDSFWEGVKEKERREVAPKALNAIKKEDKYLNSFPLPMAMEYGSLENISVIEAVVLSCDGELCSFPESPGQGDYLITVLTREGEEKWQITHGQKEEDYHVEPGYKLVSCYCDQDDCRVQSPDNRLYWADKTLLIEGVAIKAIKLFSK